MVTIDVFTITNKVNQMITVFLFDMITTNNKETVFL